MGSYCFSSRRRHTRCALVTGVQTCALPISSIIAPQLGETYALPARASARRLKTGDPELQGAVGRDWQNDYADFSIRLKKELQGIESASARREALARMSEVLRSYQDHRVKRTAKKG